MEVQVSQHLLLVLLRARTASASRTQAHLCSWLGAAYVQPSGVVLIVLAGRSHSCGLS